jgi:hypothetical protein
MRYLQILLVVLCLAGCAESRYVHERKSIKNTEYDLFVCEDTILKEHQGLRALSAREKQQLLDECMIENGYRFKGAQGP